MAFPFLAAAIGAGAIGSFLSAGSEGKRADRQAERDFAIRQEQNRISKIGAETDQTLGANQLRRQMETNPLRDRVLFGLQNRAGMTPGRFNPKDMFNPNNKGPISQGGIDFSALKQANDQFTPGAGGVNPEILQQMLGKMGFGPNATPARGPGPLPDPNRQQFNGQNDARFLPDDERLKRDRFNDTPQGRFG